MDERKLAHIEQIGWIRDIPNADKIELCGILGWQCVIAKKDNFKVGDFVIYVEVDSILPEKPEFEFLRDRKFRVKTIKLKGQVSQGLVLPVDYLKGNDKFWVKGVGFFGSTGDDVTSAIGITKYLTPSELSELQNQENAIKLEKSRLKRYLMRYSFFRRMFLSRKQKSSFPYWVKKTDEERIQNLGDKFIAENSDKVVYATEKIDYQSGTWTSKSVPRFNGLLGKLIPLQKVIFVVASRNLQTNDKNSLYWKIAEKYNLESICKKYPGIIIQGEQGNSKIQGNKYGLINPKMFVFTVIMPNGYMLDYYEMKSFCDRNNLHTVPYLGTFHMNEIGKTVNDFVEFSKGKSTLAQIDREGVVFRCVEDGEKIFSFKAINPNFLLKYDD